MRILKSLVSLDRRQVKKSCQTFGLSVCLIMFAVAAGGAELSWTGSLETGELADRTITVFAGADVRFKNNYGMSLHQASLTQISSGKRMFHLEAFPPGESLGLEFPRQGTYAFCYSVARETVPEKSTCLQIDVVALQTT